MNRVWVRENDSEEEEDRAQQRKIIDGIWATRFLTMRNMASELRQVMDRTGPYGGLERLLPNLFAIYADCIEQCVNTPSEA